MSNQRHENGVNSLNAIKDVSLEEKAKANKENGEQVIYTPHPIPVLRE